MYTTPWKWSVSTSSRAERDRAQPSMKPELLNRSHRLVPPKVRPPVYCHTPRRGPLFAPCPAGGAMGLPNMKPSATAIVPSMWKVIRTGVDPSGPRSVVHTHDPMGRNAQYEA